MKWWKAIGNARKAYFCRQYMHCVKFTSRHFMYCLSVSKEQKEVFKISFHLYHTLVEVQNNCKKNFNLHYTLTSKKAKILATYPQLKSFPLINWILLISCVLKYTRNRFKWQFTHGTNALMEAFNRNSLAVTSCENALEQALQIAYVTRSHELGLNLRPAYCATGRSSQWGVYLGVLRFCKIKVCKY